MAVLIIRRLAVGALKMGVLIQSASFVESKSVIDIPLLVAFNVA